MKLRAALENAYAELKAPRPVSSPGLRCLRRLAGACSSSHDRASPALPADRPASAHWPRRSPVLVLPAGPTFFSAILALSLFPPLSANLRAPWPFVPSPAMSLSTVRSRSPPFRSRPCSTASVLPPISWTPLRPSQKPPSCSSLPPIPCFHPLPSCPHPCPFLSLALRTFSSAGQGCLLSPPRPLRSCALSLSTPPVPPLHRLSTPPLRPRPCCVLAPPRFLAPASSFPHQVAKGARGLPVRFSARRAGSQRRGRSLRRHGYLEGRRGRRRWPRGNVQTAAPGRGRRAGLPSDLTCSRLGSGFLVATVRLGRSPESRSS